MSDLFDQLKAISVGNVLAWDELTPQERKAFNPYIVALWLSCTSDKTQVKNLASLGLLPLTCTKEVAFTLLCGACTGNKRYKWMFVKSDEVRLQCVQEYYKCTPSIALQYNKLLSKRELALMAQRLGWDDKRIKLL